MMTSVDVSTREAAPKSDVRPHHRASVSRPTLAGAEINLEKGLSIAYWLSKLDQFGRTNRSKEW